MDLLSGLDALLITNPTNIRYLTEFTGLAPEEREGYVLLTQNTLYFFTNALYLESTRNLKSQISNLKLDLQIVEILRDKPLSGRLNDILQNIGSLFARTVTLGFEETDLTFAEYQKLKQELQNVTLSPTQNRVEKLRQTKRPDEIENIRQAAKLTDECFDFILKKIKAGVTETEIAWEIESFFRKNGAEIAFPPIVVFNANSSQPHYSPSISCKLKAESLILLDFGAKVDGYCADMTRVIFIGKPTPEQKKVYQIVLSAQEAALNELYRYYNVSKHRSKNIVISGTHLDQMAREIIEKAGLPTYPHSLGHSLGLAIHEGPRLSVKHDEELKPGMVFTIEPGVYLEGKFGIRIEDLVYLGEGGVEILSKSPKELICVSNG